LQPMHGNAARLHADEKSALGPRPLAHRCRHPIRRGGSCEPRSHGPSRPASFPQSVFFCVVGEAVRCGSRDVHFHLPGSTWRAASASTLPVRATRQLHHPYAKFRASRPGGGRQRYDRERAGHFRAKRQHCRRFARHAFADYRSCLTRGHPTPCTISIPPRSKHFAMSALPR
jgi:hypothetical protein